jgi:hypothetical protein
MADKKITALTALGSTDVDPAADLLHIIDYSASPVNKKITVANLFSRVDTDTTIIGASKTFEVEHAAGTSVLEVLTNTVASTTEATVTVNKDEHNFVDFTVHSTGGEAISVDASADTVTINSDAIAALDFVVKGDTTTLIHADGGLDCVGIGTTTLSGNYSLQVLGDGVVVDSTCDIATSTALTMDDTSVIAAGSSVYGIGIAPGTTVASITNATTAVLSTASLATANNQTFTFVTSAGTGAAAQFQGFVSFTGSDNIAPPASGTAAISVETPVTRVTAPGSGTGAMTLAAGRDGQVKHLICIAATGGTADLTTTNVTDPNAAAIVFQAAGDTWTGIYDGTLAKWITLGGNGYAHG